MVRRKLGLFLVLLIVSLNAFAQNAETEVREKLAREAKMLEQILSDAKNLRLPENRAIVFARAGSWYWQTDEKKARKFFQDAVSDIITAQTEVQNDKNKQFFQALLYGQSPRLEIIAAIGSRDAELALEYLAKSRPAIIAEAMQNQNADQTSVSWQYARNEIAAEQRLIGLAAEQNPQNAIKLVRESLKKGVSYETINLLKKIYAKEPQAANELAEELAKGFIDADFSKNYQTAETVGQFVAEMGAERAKDEKSMQISEDLLRRLVTKMLDGWLSAKTAQLYGYWNCMAVIEKLFPQRAAQLKQKIETVNRLNQTEEAVEYNKLVSSDTAPEEMVARAEKFQASYRNEIYRSAAQKFAQNGKIEQAERLIENISGEQTEYYISQFYANLSYHFANLGKFDEAQNCITRIPDENQRLNALLSLANTVYQRNPKENRKAAENILNQALTIIPDTPETQNEFNSAINLAVAFAPFDSGVSFRLIESLQPSINEIIQANSVLTKFRGYGGYRQGELQIAGANFNFGVYNLESFLKLLKEKDFDRTEQFINSFSRPEARIWLQLQLIDENSPGIVSLPLGTRFFSKSGF